jgi:CCR4-NOT transcription complex subunit 1
LFEVPMSKYPELLIQTLAEIKPSRGQAMLDEVFSQIFPAYLHNHSNNIRLLESLWEANQDLVISCICELYKSESKKENSLNLSRVLDIAQVIKESLIPLTNWNDYDFAVPLAILAGKREFLHFEPWITDRIKNAGNPFLRATLAYIEDHLLLPIRKYNEANQHFNYEIVLEKVILPPLRPSSTRNCSPSSSSPSS